MARRRRSNPLTRGLASSTGVRQPPKTALRTAAPARPSSCQPTPAATAGATMAEPRAPASGTAPPPDHHRPGPAHPPLGRDKRGWQVSPAPDGRGAPPRDPPKPAHRSRWFLWFFLVLLAVNSLSVLLVQPAGQTRVTIPFSVFRSDLKTGEIKAITTKADAVQGTFKHKQRYPPSAKTATATTLFATQVPAFWNNAQLTAELEAEKVTINATSPTTS